MKSLLIYLHGFNSSPQSLKAQQMEEYCRLHRPDIRLELPQLPCYPAAAAEFIDNLIKQYQDDYRIGIVGSSLGGFLATWLNDRYQLPAVLVNPAVKPYELLTDYLGPQCNPYSGEEYLLTSDHIAELKALDVEEVRYPHQLWLLLQEGDEVLDYRQAVNKYISCKQTVEQEGDHSFVRFERFPAAIIQFLNL